MTGGDKLPVTIPCTNCVDTLRNNNKMAADEPVQSAAPGNGPKRILIDSARIKQAEDDDTKHELGFLGVSVFNQDEFEAGVMRQLDEEAARKNVEQRRRFLEKELKQVKKERRLEKVLFSFWSIFRGLGWTTNESDTQAWPALSFTSEEPNHN